ncbi:hypothetical protein V8C44DRAFT_313915, partial [Trichoderma aethiopicum]
MPKHRRPSSRIIIPSRANTPSKQNRLTSKPHACRHHHISRPRLSKPISQSHLKIASPASHPPQATTTLILEKSWGAVSNRQHDRRALQRHQCASVQLYQHSQPPATTKPHRQFLQLLTGNASKAAAPHTYIARAGISFDELPVPSCL